MALPLDIMAQPDPQAAVTSTGDQEAQKDVQLVLRRLEEGKKAREKFDGNWDEYRAYYKGEQWKDQKNRKNRPVTNIVRPVVQTILPIMTDNQPGFNVTGKKPQDFQFAETIQKVDEDMWERRGWNHTLIEKLMDACIIGTGIAKVTWNNDLEDGLGDVDVQRVDPKEIYVPKNAVDFDKNCPWAIHKPLRRLSEIKRRFPEFADQLTPDSGAELETSKSETYSGRVELVSPVDRKSPIQPYSATAWDDAQEIEIAEMWAESEEMEEFEEEDGEGGKMKGQRKKYPQGCVITVAVKQKLRLQKIPHPYKDGRKPFVRYVDTIVPGQFWGEGEIEPLMPVQKIINKTVSNILDYMNMCANPVWLVPKSAGINPDKITNAMGLILPYEGDQAPRRDIPPPLPSAFFEFYQAMTQFTDVVSGVHDVTNGRNPTGITAAQAIQTLQEAAQTRIRLKERNLNVSLDQLGTLITSRVLQFYREPRIAKVADAKGWPQYFEYFIEDVPAAPGVDGQPGQPGGYVMNRRDITVDPATGQTQSANDYQKSAPTEGLFDVKVTAGSSLPFVKAQRSDLAFKLLDAGAIDTQEVLETVDWPNVEEVEQRMQKAKAGKPTSEPPRVSYSANATDPNAAAILESAGIKSQQPPPPQMAPAPQGVPQ
jgi:hypothetical protein